MPELPWPPSEGGRASRCSVKGRGIAEYVSLPVSEALDVFERFELSERETLIAVRVLREIQERLRFLHDVGVGYLTLNRGAATLSGGEGQRIRLATQIGANLSGVLYVLDEPSVGLHQRDNRKLLVDPVAAPRSWQHGGGRGARRGNDPCGRLRGRSRAGRGGARRPCDFPGVAGRIAEGWTGVAHRRVPPRRARDSDTTARGAPP